MHRGESVITFAGLPKWAIILDAVGTLMIGAGIFLLVSAADVMGMPPIELRGLAIGMIVTGVMLMGPLLVAVVNRRRLREARNARNPAPGSDPGDLAPE